MAGISNTLPGAPIDPSLPGADIAAGTPDPFAKVRGWAQSVSNLVSGMPGGGAGLLPIPGAALAGAAVDHGRDVIATNQALNEKQAAAAAAQAQQAGPPPPPPAAPVAGTPVAQAAPAAPTGYVTGMENPSIQRVANRGGTPARDVQTRSTAANQAYEHALATSGDANQDVTARNVNLANERREVYLDEATKAGERYDAARDANAKRKAEYETRLREFDAYNKAMPDDPIDPDRFWNSRTSSQKAAGFIAAALGGWLQGSGATAQNSAVAQLNTAIEQDVASQRASYEAKKGKLGNLQTAYGLAMQKYNDADAAESAAKAYLLDQTKMRLEAEAAKKGTVDAVNAGQQAGAQLDTERAKLIEQGTKRVQATAGTPMYLIAGNPIPQTAEQARQHYEKMRLAEHQTALDITKESAKPATGTSADDKIETDAARIGEAGAKNAPARNALEQARQAHIENPLTLGEHAVDAFFQGSKPIKKWVLGKGVTDRETKWEEAQAMALNALSGAGVSDKERAAAVSRAEGARDNESRLAWLDTVGKRLEEANNAVRAGARPEAVRRYDSRLAGLHADQTFPETVKP
jgi:hypothetical protein